MEFGAAFPADSEALEVVEQGPGRTDCWRGIVERLVPDKFENGERHVRDPTFGEYASQVRTGSASRPRTSLRNLAIGALRPAKAGQHRRGFARQGRGMARPLAAPGLMCSFRSDHENDGALGRCRSRRVAATPAHLAKGAAISNI